MKNRERLSGLDLAKDTLLRLSRRLVSDKMVGCHQNDIIKKAEVLLMGSVSRSTN